MSAPSAAPESDRKEAARQRLLEAAAEVIAQRGFHGMSMRELSRAVGRSLAGFYNYFSSKEELLYALQLRAIETLYASAVDATDGIDDASARLYAFILSHVRYVADHHAAMQVLVQEAGSLDDDHRHRVRQVKERYFAHARAIVADVVKAGCAAREGRPDVDDAELDRITYSIFGMLNWTYGWYQPTQHGTSAELAKSIHALAVCGLTSSCPLSKECHQVDQRLSNHALTPLLSLSRRRAEDP